jgi:hypothetical protein
MDEARRPAGNLGPRGVRQRRVLGWVAACVALGALVWVFLAHPPWPLRLLAGIPFFVAGLGLFQARAAT